MRRANPRQNQKTRVVRNEPDVALAGLLTPPQEAVPAAQMPRRRTPRHAGDRLSVRPRQILEMFAYRLFIAQVMVMFDEVVEQRFIAGAANLLDFERPEFLQRSDHRRR